MFQVPCWSSVPRCVGRETKLLLTVMVAVSWEWDCVKLGLSYPPTGHTAHHIPTIPSWYKLDNSAARNFDSGFREPRWLPEAGADSG